MYLQAMFSLCMVESEADEVTLQGVTSVGLKHALDFAYTGQVNSAQPTRLHAAQNMQNKQNWLCLVQETGL